MNWLYPNFVQKEELGILEFHRYATVGSPGAKLSPTKLRRPSQQEFQSRSEPHTGLVRSPGDVPKPLLSRSDSPMRTSDPVTIPGSSSATVQHRMSSSLEESLEIEDHHPEVSSSVEAAGPSWPSPQTSEATRTRSKRRPSFYFAEEGHLNDDDWKKLAFEGFRNSLGVSDEDIDQTKVIVKELQPGVCLIHEESLEDTKLFYVLSGALTVSLQSQADKKDEILQWVQQSSLFLAHVGEMTGALAVLTGEPSLFTVKTRYASRVGILEKSTVYE
ncbi:PNPLA6 [Cordylochernes scorpioides]|uniref:PNPLA6 n=1 Tax=Cordylochernes scorpioides TaxID=51811 RepID=A0ABY6L4Y4_9ARAC|nr:PNPLA6 [Cordylochernes scorpioides]